MNEKRNKRIKQRSTDRAKEERQYLKRNKVWLHEHIFCEACAATAPFRTIHEYKAHGIRRADQVHHKAGKEHGLLLDESLWLAVCGSCHRWIEDHGRAARCLGLVVDKPTSLDLPGMVPTPRVFH